MRGSKSNTSGAMMPSSAAESRLCCVAIGTHSAAFIGTEAAKARAVSPAISCKVADAVDDQDDGARLNDT